MAELMNREVFRAALEEAIKGKSANKAPFSVAWASGKLTRAHLARWAENHYHYVGPFADYLGYIYARTPDRYTEAKDFLLANMYEEEIGGDRHTDLLIRFAEACGTTRDRVIDPDNMSPTTRGLQSWCYAVAMREDPIVAVAGLVVGLESQVPSIYRKQTPSCATSTSSRTRRSSSSTCISSRTRSMASVATRSCSSTPTRPSCSSAA